MKRLENAQDPVQGFAPRSIAAQANGTLVTTHVLAFCFPEDDVTYQINAAGETATLTAGTIRVVDSTVTSIVFSGISTTAKLELM